MFQEVDTTVEVNTKDAGQNRFTFLNLVTEKHDNLELFVSPCTDQNTWR